MEIHEEYEECQSRGGSCRTIPKYDVALLTLSEDVTMTDFIQPACLPPPDTMISFTNLVVIGWGNTASGLTYTPADILQKLYLKEGCKECLMYPLVMLVSFSSAV